MSQISIGKKLEMLLFFHDLPEKLVGRDEALEIAACILRLEPGNQLALRITKSGG